MEAMDELIQQANHDTRKIAKIKSKQLIGIELDPTLFALACSNMFLHGDGRTNLIFRNSLLSVDDKDDIVFLKYIKSFKPNKVIINPPYENNKPIRFTLQALQYLEPNGKLIIIMPTPTLTHNQCGLTEEVLKIAKLDFVIKMPEKLFTEQRRTVNTSVFGFTKTPHDPKDSVLFYQLSDDGFVSIQHKGRVDKGHTWEKREARIIETIFGQFEIDGICEKRLIYQGDLLNCAGIRKRKDSQYELVTIHTLFDYEYGTLASESNDEDGEYDFITASNEWKKHSAFTHDCEAIIFAVAAAGSLGRTHYVNGKFIASNLCLVLTPKSSAYKIDMRFYKFYFDGIREQLRSDLADGTSKLTISPDDLMGYYIDYVPYDRQLSFYSQKIRPYEELQRKLKELEQDLKNGIIDLTSNN